MPPKRPVRRSLPTPRQSQTRSESRSLNGSSSPDPLDVISNQGSPKSQKGPSVYISGSKSNTRERENNKSTSPIELSEDSEESSSSDSQDSVKDQYRRQRAYSQGPEGESEEDSEDEWSTFLSLSDQKQRRQSSRSYTSSSGRSRRPSVQTSEITNSSPYRFAVPSSVASNRPFQLNPVRSRPSLNMVDDAMNGDGGPAEDLLLAEGEEIQSRGQEVEENLPQALEPPPVREEVTDALEPPQEAVVEVEQATDDTNDMTKPELGIGEEPQSSAIKVAERETEIHEEPAPTADPGHSSNDLDVQMDRPASEVVGPAVVDNLTQQAETQTDTIEDGTQTETSLPTSADQTATQKDQTVDHDPEMPTVDPQTDTEMDHQALTPAGTSVAGVEEGEEELDQDIAPSPEADQAGNADANVDVEMDGLSVLAEDTPSAEVKIKKKPGPKPKAKHAVQKVEFAAKKATKLTKGKKVDELKGSSKSKAARFTPSAQPSSVSAASEQADDTPEPTSDKRYCICRKRESDDDEDVTMVGCESCDEWFHASCIGLTEDQVKNMDVYICRSCERSTKQKTIYKKTCKRDGCDKGLGLRASKFCSDLCAYKYHKIFVDSITNKKTLKALSTSFDSFPKPVPVQVIHHGETLPTVPKDDHAQQLIAAIQSQLVTTTNSLEIVRKRQQILQKAIDHAESLPPIIVQAEENRSSKSKRKGGGGPTEDKQCAWDPSLIWDDEEVQSWVEGHGSDVEICELGKRRCDKHSGWQKTSAFSLETEEYQLSQKQKALSSQEANLVKAVEAVSESDKAKSEFQDRLIAKGKA